MKFLHQEKLKNEGLNMAEKTRKIIDAHGHLVQYIAGTGAGGELRFVGNGMAEYAPERGSVFFRSSLTAVL